MLTTSAADGGCERIIGRVPISVRGVQADRTQLVIVFVRGQRSVGLGGRGGGLQPVWDTCGCGCGGWAGGHGLGGLGGLGGTGFDGSGFRSQHLAKLSVPALGVVLALA